jgi:hypothetical protein
LREQVRRAEPPYFVASLLVSIGTLLAVSFPGWELLSGGRTSVLSRLGVAATFVTATAPRAEEVFLLALLALVVGETIAVRRLTSSDGGSGGSRGQHHPTVEKRTYWLLVCGSLIAMAVGHGSLVVAYSTRGEIRGLGYLTVVEAGAPVAVALGIMRRHWRSRALWLVSAFVTCAYVIVSGTRTPLLVVGVALVLAAATRLGRARLTKVLAILLVLAYVGSVVVVSLSEWRAQVATGQNASISQAVRSVAGDPFSQLATNGHLDTLDGLVLAMNVNRNRVHAQWWDPAKAVLNLVPYQLWPQKPPWLGAVVSHTYTDFGGNAGIFLSGPGYAWIVYGGLAGVLVVFLVVGAIGALAARMVRTSPVIGVLLTYFVFRFCFAGDAFDLFETIEFVGMFVLATMTAKILGGAGERRDHGLGRARDPRTGRTAALVARDGATPARPAGRS